MRSRLLRRYAPLFGALALQLAIIAAVPSTAPDQSDVFASGGVPGVDGFDGSGSGTVDPATGQVIDPATGQVIDPATGQVIDPATGQPIAGGGGGGGGAGGGGGG